MLEQHVAAMSARKNNPLFALDVADNVQQASENLFEQTFDVDTDPREGATRAMHRMATVEQLVTYADGRVQQEAVCWDKALQIYYWQSKTDRTWYFEDPCNDDAITKVSGHKELLEELKLRQFWWLETDEDVAVSKNPDGSKRYAYKGLSDPAEITALLEAEAERAAMAERPVSPWKAVALSAMTLLGHSMGFQAWAKSAVSRVEPKQAESPSVDTSTDGAQSFFVRESAEHKQPVYAASANHLVHALQFFSTMATGVASVIRAPRKRLVTSG